VVASSCLSILLATHRDPTEKFPHENSVGFPIMSDSCDTIELGGNKKCEN